MKTLRYAAMALAVSGVFTLGAKADSTTNDWWNVDFQALAEYVPDQPDIGMTVLTNKDVEAAGALVTTQTWMSGVWYTLDGDETTVTNEYNPTNTYKAFGFDTCLKLDTQGNDLTWVPTNGVEDITWTPASSTPPNSYPTITNVATVIDADLFLVGSDSAPDVSDFDAAHDVQAAVYLKNETDEDSGETTNSVLCVYVWDDDAEANYWQELKGVELEDNSWARVQVVVDHSKATPEVKVYVNGIQMTARDGDADHWTAANFTTAADAHRVTSVSFRGTGAVDNFVGRYVETTYEKFDFTAEVYMNDALVAEGEAGNVTRVETGVEAGEGKVATFEDFLLSNYDYDFEETNATWALSKVVVINQGTGAETTYNYEWNPLTFSVDSLDGDNPAIDIKTATGAFGEYQTGLFDAIPSTAGATKNGTIIRIYFENLPEDGTFSAIATTTVGGTTTTDAKKVRPSEFEGGATKTVSWEFPATKDGNILSTIQVSNGAKLTYESRTATVSITLDEPLLANTTFAEATYVAGSLADGQDLRWTEENGLYTFEAYVPPVAIIVAGAEPNEYPSLRAAIAAAQAGDTIQLVADDAVSFTAEDTEIVINKALTIDGGSNTLYGVTDYAYDGVNDHDLFIAASAGDVTIKNLTFSEFSDTAPTVQYRTYPIWTSQAYAGKLTLDGVTVEKFARTAINLGNGTFEITNCVIKGYAGDAGAPARHFQNAITVLDAKGTVADTTATGIGSTADPWGAGLVTYNKDGAGEVKFLSGSYTADFIAEVSSNATGKLVIEGGTFIATAPAEDEGQPVSAFQFDDDVPALKVTISGGWFDREPKAGFITNGMSAVNYGAAAPTAAAPWTVEGAKVTVTWVITETSSNMVQVAVGSQVSAYEGDDVVNGTKTFKFWSADGTTEATFPVTAEGNLTFFAVWEDAAVDPIAVDPGTSLTAADKTNGDLPIEVTADGFVVKFRSSQPNIVYQLVASDTVNPADWTACTPVGDPVTSSAAASAEETQLITLTAPMTDNVKFFKIKASVPAGN